MPAHSAKASTKLYKTLYRRAVLDAFKKLNPRWMVRNPVMFVVEIGAVLTAFLWVQSLSGRGEASPGFIGAVSLWLWFTVLFANFAEALAEGRGEGSGRSPAPNAPGDARKATESAAP